MEWLNKYWIGIVVGMLITALFGYIYMEQMNLITYVFEYGFCDLVPRIITVALFPNMALLFLLYQLELWKTAKGVGLSMAPYLMAAIYFFV